MKKCKYHCDYGDGENCHFSEDKCIYNEDVVEKINCALKTFYGFYMTEEDTRKCENTNK